MLDKLRTTAKDSVVYGLGNMATKLVGLFLLPIYTSKFSVAEYGAIGLLEVSIRILVVLFGMNLFNAFFRWYWDKELANKRESMFFTVISSVSVLAFFFAGILVLFGDGLAISLLGNKSYSLCFKLAIASAALETIAIVPFTLLRLQGRSGKFTITSLVRLLVNVSLNITLIVGFNKGIESVYYSSIAGSLIYLIWLLPYIWDNIKLRFETTILKSMFRYSIPLMLSSVSGIVLAITDRYVIQYKVGLDEVGTYSLGFKLANVIKFLVIAPINMAVMPIFYRIIGDPDSKRFYARFTTYFAYLVGITILGVSLFSEHVVKLFAQKSEYWDSFLIVPIIAFGIFFGMLKDMSLTGLHIKRQTGIIGSITLIMSGLNLILNLILVPRYQGIGAATATLTVQVLFFIIVFTFAQKRYPIPYEVKRIFILLFNIIGLLLISKLFTAFGFYTRIAIYAGVLISYPFMLYLFGFYEDREFVSILGFIRKWRNPKNWSEQISGMLGTK